MNEKPWKKGSLATGLWRKLNKELNDETYDVPEKDPTRASALLRIIFPRQPFGAELVSSLSPILTGILALSALGYGSKESFFTSSMFTFLISYCIASYDVYIQEKGLNPNIRFTDILYSPFNGLCERALLKEWRFHILVHAVLMVVQLSLMSKIMVRCGLARTLAVMECGHTAIAILAFASKYYVHAAIDSTYSSSSSSPSSSPLNRRHHRSGSDLIDAMSGGNGAGSENSSDLVNDTSRGRPEDALLLSMVLVGGGLVMLMYCDLHNTTNAVLVLSASFVCYIRYSCLLSLPKQIQTLPLGLAGTLLVPFGVRSAITSGFGALFNLRFPLSLIAAVFSRFAEFRTLYVCKRRKRRDGLLHVTTELCVILIGFVIELIFAVEPKCTFFTIASSCIILSGIHAAMVHLPSEVSSPKLTEKDYINLAIFAKKSVLLSGPRSQEKLTAYPQKLKAHRKDTNNTFSRGFRSLFETPRTRKLLLYFVLCILFMVLEIGYGFLSNSLSLISEGFHMLFDCFCIFIGLCASFMSRWEGNDVFSYSYGRVQTLSCLVNCVSLVVVSVTIFLESVHRFFNPAEIHGDGVLILSIISLFVNLVGIFSFHGDPDSGVHYSNHGHQQHHHHSHGLFRMFFSETKSIFEHSNTHHRHHHHLSFGSDENMYSIFLHIFADTMGSVGLIVSSYLVQRYGWTIADPICSILISMIVFISVCPLLKLSWCVLLQGTTLPENRIASLEERLSEAAAAAWEADGATEAMSSVVTELYVWDKFPGCLVATAVLHIPETANEQRVLASALTVMNDYGITSSCIECVKNKYN